MVWKGNIKPNYWMVTKEKIRGSYIATPYASKPKPIRNHIIVSGKKYHYYMNKYGYAELKTLPTTTLKKPRSPRSRGFDFGFSHF